MLYFVASHLRDTEYNACRDHNCSKAPTIRRSNDFHFSLQVEFVCNPPDLMRSGEQHLFAVSIYSLSLVHFPQRKIGVVCQCEPFHASLSLAAGLTEMSQIDSLALHLFFIPASVLHVCLTFLMILGELSILMTPPYVYLSCYSNNHALFYLFLLTITCYSCGQHCNSPSALSVILDRSSSLERVYNHDPTRFV